MSLFISLFVPLAAASDDSKKKLKVVFGVFRPPYVFEKTNKGLDIEITEAVFKRIGLDFEHLHSPNERALKEIEAKKVDAIVGTSIELSLKSKVCFTDPILLYDNVAVSKLKSKVTLKTIDDLKNHNFLSFSKASRYLGDEYKKLIANLKRDTDTTNQRRQNILFWEDKVTVIILDLNVFKFYKKELSTSLKTADEVVIHRIFDPSANPRVVAFHDKSMCAKFNRGLSEIKADGTYQNIFDKYLSVSPN